MTANAFYITLVTVEDIELGQYDEVASAFVKAFFTVTSEHLVGFTKPHLSDPRCEVEVMAVPSDSDSKYTLSKRLRSCRRRH